MNFRPHRPFGNIVDPLDIGAHGLHGIDGTQHAAHGIAHVAEHTGEQGHRAEGEFAVGDKVGAKEKLNAGCQITVQVGTGGNHAVDPEVAQLAGVTADL